LEASEAVPLVVTVAALTVANAKRSASDGAWFGSDAAA
jgi:hypothetical protein